MQRIHRYLGSLLLGATLVAPMAIQAAVNLQGGPLPAYKLRDDDDKREKAAKRYYDRERKDYHEWNEAENNAYRHWWMEERHEREMRDFNRLRAAQQAEYWRWRHEHPDWH
jgi:hypothetical protein